MSIQKFDERTGEVIDLDKPGRLTSRAIADIAEDMVLAEKLVTTLLKDGVDYGQTPGTQGKGLWDPGAAKIIRAFQTHVEHKVIFHEETDDLISWTIEAQLILNSNGMIIGSGLGCASTREVKYKYRWVLNPEEFGYSPEEIPDLKTRPAPWDNKVTQFRVENPEYGDLVNTLLQMACKRAEVDGARSLPGVGSVLRVVLDPRARPAQPARAPEPGSQGTSGEPDWKWFWGIINGMGINEKSAHTALGVHSMKDWIAAGHTLDEAIITIGKKLTDLVKAKAKPAEDKKPVSAPPVTKIPADIAEADVPDIPQLLFWCKRFWNMEEQAVFEELGYSSRLNFEEAQVQSPFEAYQTIYQLRTGL